LAAVGNVTIGYLTTKQIPQTIKRLREEPIVPDKPPVYVPLVMDDAVLIQIHS
jgi:hypothetical protein